MGHKGYVTLPGDTEELKLYAIELSGITKHSKTPKLGVFIH
jgi:hypothetical protein